MTRHDESLQAEDNRRLDLPDAAAWRRVLEDAPVMPFDDSVLEAPGPFDAALHAWRAFQKPDTKGAVAERCTSAEADTDTPHRVIDHTIGRIEDSQGLSSYIDLDDAWAQTRGARVQRLPRDVWLVLADRDARRRADEVIRIHVPAEMDDAEVESMQDTLSALAGRG